MSKAGNNKKHESWFMTAKPSSPNTLSQTNKWATDNKQTHTPTMANVNKTPVLSQSEMGKSNNGTKIVQSSGAVPKNKNVQQMEKTFSPSIANESLNEGDQTKSTGNANSVEGITEEKELSEKVVQTGFDRYILVKRKSSPLKGNDRKIIRAENNVDPLSKNRFSTLSIDDESPDSNQPAVKVARPPPIYLRERSSNELVKNITKVIGNSSFHIVPLLKGKIHETKVQTYDEKSYREITNYFNTAEKKYYTYQLKSSKGLIVVIKGIESDVPPDEIKSELVNKGYRIRSVINIFNRDKVPQPMFKIELEPDTRKLKRNEVHPIYKLQYLLHRRISVDEPHKRWGPVQCQNCQEYGHTKKYCVLQTVCVVCGDLHQTSKCSVRTQELKKCSNCGGNHTANYRGCPIYKNLKRKYDERLKTVREGGNTPQLLEIRSVPAPQPNIPSRTVPFGTTSYASILKPVPQQSPTVPQNGMESMIQQLTQSLNMFMSTMQSMLQNFMESQNQLIQAFISRK